MTISELLSNPEFWAALFGAMAAFLLGALGQWWAANGTKSSAGNLALITLSQMYARVENLRQHFLIEEASRAAKALGAEPFSVFLRPAIGMPTQDLRLKLESLGFLADSHDPDILNRLLTVERQFTSMLDLVQRHHELHMSFQDIMSRTDPTGKRQIPIGALPAIVGAPLIHQLDDTIEGLVKGIPETRDNVLAVGGQLRDILRVQFPTRRFVSFVRAPQSRTVIDLPPGLPGPSVWRRVARSLVDVLVKRRTFSRARAAEPQHQDEEVMPRIRRVTACYDAATAGGAPPRPGSSTGL